MCVYTHIRLYSNSHLLFITEQDIRRCSIHRYLLTRCKVVGIYPGSAKANSPSRWRYPLAITREDKYASRGKVSANSLVVFIFVIGVVTGVASRSENGLNWLSNIGLIRVSYRFDRPAKTFNASRDTSRLPKLFSRNARWLAYNLVECGKYRCEKHETPRIPFSRFIDLNVSLFLTRDIKNKVERMIVGVALILERFAEEIHASVLKRDFFIKRKKKRNKHIFFQRI